MSARTTSDQVLRLVIGIFALGVIAIAADGAYWGVHYLRHPPGGFGCRAVQSEAKTNLSGIFTAEKAFFGEYGSYSTDLVAVNWVPDGTPRYVYGFAKPGGPTQIKGIDDLDPTRDSTADPRVQAFATKAGYGFRPERMHDLAGNPLTPSELPPTAVLTSSGFSAAAVGDVDTDDTVQLDVWTIDQQKQLQNVQNDCAN